MALFVVHAHEVRNLNYLTWLLSFLTLQREALNPVSLASVFRILSVYHLAL